MKIRTPTEIIQNILSVAKGRNIFQLKLIKSCNISPQSFEMYRKALVENKRLEEYKNGKDNKIYYKTTKRGIETLKSLKKMHIIKNNIMRSIGLSKKDSKDLNT